MPRVRKQKKSARGTRVCGAIGCRKEIQPGEEYFTWSFRFGGRQVRCLEHPPKQSELTQSKMSTVYAAMEDIETEISGTLEDVKGALESIAETVREVANEYEEAAQNFGGAGENQERADELNAWADALEQFEPDADDQEFDEAEHDEEAKELSDADGMGYTDAMQQLRDEWENEHESEIEEALENAQNEARDLLSQCPF